jgi:hypothetical protein
MAFTWWVELAPTLAFGADGRLDDTGFADALGPDGPLGAPVAALGRSLAAHPSDDLAASLVITPSLVDQAQRMVHGYTRADGTPVAEGEDGAATAATFLDALKDVLVGRGIQTVATPFSGPTLTSMLASDLGGDLDDQQTFGADLLEALAGVPIQTQVARPVNGALSDQALDWLAASDVTTILGDTETVERIGETAVPGEPAPTATLSSTSGTPLNVVLPDPGAQGLLARPDLLANPVRAAQSVLGELAVEWKESPVPEEPTVRGRALALLSSSLPPDVWTPLIERLRNAPFLRNLPPATFATSVDPPGAPATIRAPDGSSFPSSYTEGPNGIRGLHGQIADYRSMLTEESDGPETLTTQLYYAESARYVDDPLAGTAWLDSVRTSTRTVFESVRPQVGQGFTFTSGEGTIPLVMGDPGPIPLRITIRLDSSQFEYPKGSEQNVVLVRPAQVVTFPVIAKATGQNPILVRVLAPNGHGIGEPQAIVVRSTAFNHIALIVTLAAAAVLAALYSRRWFRRTKVPS